MNIWLESCLTVIKFCCSVVFILAMCIAVASFVIYLFHVSTWLGIGFCAVAMFIIAVVLVKSDREYENERRRSREFSAMMRSYQTRYGERN